MARIKAWQEFAISLHDRLSPFAGHDTAPVWEHEEANNAISTSVVSK